MKCKMKKTFIAFMMPFLACTTGFAQEEGVAASATPQDSVPTYWTDPVAGNKRLLNKSKFGDNWFIGLQAGGLYTWGTNTSDAKFFDQIRPAAAISIGKWLAPAGGFRVQGTFGDHSGRTAKGGMYHWMAGGVALDGLFNFTNIFCGYEEDRPFNLIGILGVGYEHTFGFSDRDWNKGDFDPNSTDLLSVRLGLMANFRISEAWDFNVEVTNSWLDDSFDGIDGEGSNNRWDGHANLLLGFTYRFKNHDGSHQFTYATRDMSKYDPLNDEINRLRAANQVVVAPVTKVETEVVTSDRVNTFISFDNNSAAINKLQEVNVYTAAEGMKKFPDADLYITSSDAVKNTELFMERAQSVRNVLANTYSIPAGRIFIEKNPAVIDSLDPQKACVIVYINE